jgi:hypothetical protein
MARFFVQVYLQSFYTEDSGDIAGEGEFYFKINGTRYPNKGIIKLGKKETFNPNPAPVFYTAIVDGKEKELKVDFEVWEDDIGRDDKFLDQKIKINVAPQSQVLELRGKKKPCILKLIVNVAETRNW